MVDVRKKTKPLECWRANYVHCAVAPRKAKKKWVPPPTRTKLPRKAKGKASQRLIEVF